MSAPTQRSMADDRVRLKYQAGTMRTRRDTLCAACRGVASVTPLSAQICPCTPSPPLSPMPTPAGDGRVACAGILKSASSHEVPRRRGARGTRVQRMLAASLMYLAVLLCMGVNVPTALGQDVERRQAPPPGTGSRYIIIYLCLCVCIYVVHTLMYAYIYICINIHVGIYVYKHVHILCTYCVLYKYVYVHIYVCVYVFIHVN